MVGILKKIVFIIVLLLSIYFLGEKIYASELTDDLFNYSEIQKFIDNENIGNNISFSELVNDFIKGDIKSGLGKIIDMVKDNLFSEIRLNLKTIKIIISIVLITVVFVDFSGIVKSGQSLEIGFLISYLMIMSYIIVSF